MNKTKLKILHSSINLFNTNGSINVVLQKIADDVNISIGNLTYHFKNKDAILISIFDLIQDEIIDMFKGLSLIPTITEIIGIETKLLSFQDKYRFVFLDFANILNSNTDLANKFRESISFQINIIAVLLNQGVEIGNYKNEYQAEFENLAKIIWNIYFSRPSRELIMNEKYGTEEFAQDIWLVLKPFLTPKGIARYEHIVKKNTLKIED